MMTPLGLPRTVTFDRLPAASAGRRPVRVQAVKKDNGKRELSKELGGLTLAAGITSAVAPQAAQAADDIDYLDYFIQELIDGINSLGALARFIGGTLEQGVDLAKQGYEIAAPVVGETYEAVKPSVAEGVKTLSDAAAPAVSAVSPSVQEGVKGAESFLTDQGVNVEVLKSGAATAATTAVQTTGEAVTAATPAVKTIFNYLTTTDPTLLGFEAIGIYILYLLAAPTTNVVSGLLRGYAGNITPAAALDVVTNQGDAYVVDIRAQAEKERTGAPDFPGSAGNRYLELEYAETANRKLRNQLRKVNELESQVTALLIASLKKLDKGSTIYILDKNGSQAPAIARELDGKGFKKCYVIKGGYAGWTRAKLQIKPSMVVTTAEVIAPLGTIFGNGTVKGSTSSKVIAAGNGGRRALPPGK